MLIFFFLQNAQIVLLKHGEHTYYGDSDLEDFDDEQGEVPGQSKSVEGEVSEESKSVCKSDVSCFSFCCTAQCIIL